MEMPSDTAMVTNSSGKPPASRTPSFDRFASRSSGRLHGVTSFHDDATATCGLSQSASVMPTARNIARAGARSMPSVTSRLRDFRFAMRAGYAAPTWASSGPVDQLVVRGPRIFDRVETRRGGSPRARGDAGRERLQHGERADVAVERPDPARGHDERVPGAC